MYETISESDYQSLVQEFNATDDSSTLGFCLPRLFEGVVERYPTNTAVISGDTKLDYQTVNGQANRLARTLVKEQGIGHGDAVGVALDRSANLVVAILAVMKSGAAYVPLDPSFPSERLIQTINDARPKLVITSESAITTLSSCEDISLLDFNELLTKMENADSSNIITIVPQPEDLAYIIYTSGSTGRPKGVEANHGALCNLLLSMQRQPGCDPEDRVLAVATISFDMSILDLLLPLCSGAAVVIPQTVELRDTSALLSLMERYGVTMIQATPSFFQMLMNGGWEGNPRLSKVLTAGEPVSRRQLERLLDYADNVWNGYGPTEATVYSSVGRVNREDKDIVIGTPIANFRLYVLRPEDLSLAPLGSLGELYIGGIGVNCGYRNNPELTGRNFLDKNPFHPGRLYRSGDLARFIAPGKLSLVGRTDSQVKVRGYRIELGDVSAAIAEHNLVSEAHVLLRDGHLVAYYKRNSDNSGTAQRNGNSTSLDRDLRMWLSARRPAYMVPAYFVEMARFPMTLNGKIDKRALPNPSPAEGLRTHKSEPMNQTERSVWAAWVLALGHDCFGIDDNFFEVGGDSVRIPRLKTELEKLLNRPILAAKLFQHYSIRSFAEYLDHNKPNGTAFMNGVSPCSSLPQAKTDHIASASYDDIAIVSMACRFPGGVTSPDEYWDLLEKGGDGIIDVPKGRWDAEAIYSADPDAPGKSYCKRGGFISEDMEGIYSFDAPFFGISPREARTLDPVQHVMLETCWEAFERAGYAIHHLRGSQIGVFIGQNNVSAYNPAARDLDDLDGYAATGSIGASISGRISYVLGLEGPSLTVDTACSSSLVSTHLACAALRQGECDMAVAGGVTLMLTPALHVEFSRLKGISADGTCRAFDDCTNGTGFSEGSAAVVLKRLSDAQRDGDMVHAVIRGTAVNHGGRAAASLTTPSGAAQERLIRSALTMSGLSPKDVDYIDAHGTATKLGDPIEGTALAGVFKERPATQSPLLVGSVKSNIGHTQAAAGLASLIKVVLALKNNLLPRTLHVSKPSSLVEWEASNMALVLENRPWLSDGSRRRRAGVSSFGISGTNAHLVIEEVQPRTTRTKPNVSLSPAVVPFLLSAQNDTALQQQAEKLYMHISKTEDDDRQYFIDEAYTMAACRSHFRRRLVLLVRDKGGLLEMLSSYRDSEAIHPAGVIHNTSAEETVPRLAFLFTGQGSQRLGMGKALYDTYPSFRTALDETVAHFTDLEVPLLDVMWATPGGKTAALLTRTDFAQSAIFSLEVALFRLWQSWGIQPDALVGHSIGEIAAIHVAGVLNLSDACRLVSARGRLMRDLASTRPGGMGSLEADSHEVATAISTLGLTGSVEIAGLNTPRQTVVSGDADAVTKMIAHFSQKLGRKVKNLDVAQAFHSFHMDGMLEAFRAVAETLRFHPPKLRVVSSVSGKLAAPGQLESPDYWVQQVRQPVRFADSIHTIYNQEEVNMFLELGPQPVLLGMAAACITSSEKGSMARTPSFLPSLNTGKHQDMIVVQRTLAEFHVRRMTIDWLQFFQPFSCHKVEMPTYSFQRQRYNWSETSDAKHSRSNGVPRLATSLPSNGDTVKRSGDDFELEINWHCVQKNRAQMTRDGSWGLWYPDGPVSWGLKASRALSQAGIHLIQVDKLQHAEHLDGVICMWDDSSDAEVPTLALTFASEALAQLQTAATLNFARPIVWVTRQSIGTRILDNSVNGTASNGLVNGHHASHASERARGMAAAPLWGLMRTARSEHPELQLRLIDLDLKSNAFVTLATALMISSEPECAVRNGQVVVPRLQRSIASRQSPEPKKPIISRDGAVLITGGLGGIGKQIAKWLAKIHNVHRFVLTSRRGLATPGAEAVISELEELGATVTVAACDVSDFDSMRQVLSIFDNGEHPLRGVIHAAGIVDNGVLSTMTAQRCATVFAPKVAGAWNLHQLTQRTDLDFFMMFSSISGVLGSLGLGNYAAANTFLDALADLRRAHHLPATSVAYGIWEGDGMATGLTGRTTLNHLNKFGLGQLKPTEGLQLFERALSSDRTLTVAAALNLERLQQYLAEEEGENGGIPPFYRSLFQETKPDKKKDNKAPNGAPNKSLQEVLTRSDPSQHARIVLSMVRETVAKALGFMSADEVDVNVPLKDIGFDSLTAVLIRNQLASLTSLRTLSAGSIAWKYPNLKALSQFLLDELQRQTQTSDITAVKSENNVADTAVSPKTTPITDEMAIGKGCLDPTFTFGKINEVPRPRSVFITGATGFVGAFILHQILERGVTAYCLLRAKDTHHGRERLISALDNYGLWKSDYTLLLNPIVGDAGKTFFGLSEEGFNELANSVDAICHASALVDWMRPLSDYIGPNVVSAHEVLRLASSGREKAVHVISTLATLPMHLGYNVPEEDREYGYSTSKYMAEKLVAAARWRGAKASVYRVPFVTASTLGRFRLDRGDFLHNLIVGSIELGYFPSLDADMSVVHPVDYLSKTITSIMFDDRDRIGQDFDFVNKYAAQADYFFQLMDVVSGGQGQNLIPFLEWKQRAMDYAAEHPRSSLSRISTIVEGLADEAAAAIMLTGLPTGAHVLGGDLYPAPEINEQLVRNYWLQIDAVRSKAPNSVGRMSIHSNMNGVKEKQSKVLLQDESRVSITRLLVEEI
ncbi:nonribosomal peptide synthetase 7 [Xylaria sp. FL1042]|nr:nonribosomal peptide synthetase 7 [Xylaria sp. FL1042]